MFQKFLNTAVSATRLAGKISLNYFRKGIKVKDKKSGGYKFDWVTKADIECEKIIRKNIEKNFPSHGINGEELGKKVGSSKYTWYIDPISNTKNFIRGLPHYAVIVGLTLHQEPILGVVFDPYYGELYFAQKGKGAFCKNKRLKVSKTSKLEGGIGILDLNLQVDQEEFKKTERIYRQIRDHSLGSRFFGSSGLHLSYLSSGYIDFYLNNKLDIRSHVGSSVIANEAGAKITTFKGEKWQIGEESIVVSNGKLHQQILKYFQQKSAK